MISENKGDYITNKPDAEPEDALLPTDSVKPDAEPEDALLPTDS
ncbi:hypothetical protein BH20ACI4_BH20ACI4_12220 [soil metagenome]